MTAVQDPNGYSPQALSQRMFAVDLSLENVKLMLNYQMHSITEMQHTIKDLQQQIHTLRTQLERIHD